MLEDAAGDLALSAEIKQHVQLFLVALCCYIFEVDMQQHRKSFQNIQFERIDRKFVYYFYNSVNVLISKSLYGRCKILCGTLFQSSK